MTRTRFLAHLAVALLLGTLAATPLSAQQPPAPPRAPASPPPGAEQPPAAPAPAEGPPAEQAPADDDLVRLHGSRVRIAQDYTIPKNHVAQDVQVVFGDVIVEGRIERDLVVTMGSIRLASGAVVRGAVVAVGGNVTVEPDAEVGRDLIVIGGTLNAPAEFAPRGEQVIIGNRWIGDSLHGVLPWITGGLLLGRPIVPSLPWVWGIVGVLFLLYLALNTVFDRPVALAADALGERPLSAFLTGLLVLVLTVPALAIIVATVIGLAIVPFLLCALVVVALLGKTAVARALGRTVVRPAEEGETRFQAFAAFVLGFVLLTLAYMVPVLGFVAWALATVFGMGAGFITIRGYVGRERRSGAPARAEEPVLATAGTAPVTVAPAVMAQVAADSVPPVMPDPPTAPPSPVEVPLTGDLRAFPRATFLDRLAAFVIDLILVGIAMGVLDLHDEEGSYFLVLLAYHIAFWAWKGTTLGGIICNLKVIRTHGSELRFVDALVRGLSAIFSIVALGIGCLWMIQDRERQMWHDKIAGTFVIKAPREVILP